MRYLIDYANREDVSGLIDRAMSFDIVHGIVVYLDPTWLVLWRLSQSLTANDWKSLDHDLVYLADWNERMWGRPFRTFGAWQMGLSGLFGSWETGQMSPVKVDPKWSCVTWDELSHRGRPQRVDPFVINVLVIPRSPRGTFEELANSLGEGGQRIRFEARPMGVAYSARKRRVRPLQGGISLGSDAGDYGTLGGILKDKKGALYALTCGHVIARNDEAKQPSPKDGKAASRVGMCVESTGGSLRGPATRCGRKSPANEVDAALILIDEEPKVDAKLEVMSVGPLTGWSNIDDVYEDSPVQVSGRSGHRNLYTGGLLAVGSLRIGADRFCFRNLLEIRRASVKHWGMTGSVAPPVHPGDSGAWVIQDGPAGPEWCAMVVGGSGPVGYAVFAENIMDWLKSKKHGSLSVA